MRVIEGLVEEAGNARFGDQRLTNRFQAILRAVALHPDLSFPRAMQTSSSLEALYRFLQNPRVTPEAVLAPHASAAVERARAARSVLAIHDTSEFAPSSADTEGGFYELQKGRCGLLAHFTLLVGAAEPCPLGVSGFTIVDRVARPKEHSRKRWSDAEKESRRWWTSADRVADQLGPDVDIVHVMDREADSYQIFSMLRKAGHEFVIRLHHDRRAAVEEVERIERLSAIAAERPIALEREVKLSARKAASAPQQKRRFPARESRAATLEIRAASVVIERPYVLRTEDLPPTLNVNVVFVTEPDPPSGAEPVSWKLLTTLPIDTPEQLGRVIDTYRGRWLIEEFFKALKTGCAVEQRPLESRKTCSTALALFVPVAIQLLQLRFVSRQAPTAPASILFTKEQIAAVRQHAASDRRLPPRPSVRHVMLAIAGFGGHLKSNGDPGWHVLGRGYQRLCEMLYAENYPRPRGGPGRRLTEM